MNIQENTQEKTLEVFARMARFVIRNQSKSTPASYDYVGQLINNMQNVNITLTAAAIKLIKKMRTAQNVNVDQLTSDMQNVISNSVANYIKTA